MNTTNQNKTGWHMRVRRTQSGQYQWSVIDPDGIEVQGGAGYATPAEAEQDGQDALEHYQAREAPPLPAIHNGAQPMAKQTRLRKCEPQYPLYPDFLDDPAIKGIALTRALVIRASDQGIDRTALADRLDMTEPFVRAVLSGARSLARINQDKLRGVADFLRMSYMQVLLLAEIITPADLLRDTDADLQRSLESALDAWERDQEWGHLAPTRQEWGALSLNTRVGIVLLWEREKGEEMLARAQALGIQRGDSPAPPLQSPPAPPAAEKEAVAETGHYRFAARRRGRPRKIPEASALPASATPPTETVAPAKPPELKFQSPLADLARPKSARAKQSD